MFAFADDKVFLSETYIGLKKVLSCLQVYFGDNLLEMNVDKTQIVLFQKGGFGHKKKLTKLKYNNEDLDNVGSYTYLEVPFAQ